MELSIVLVAAFNALATAITAIATWLLYESTRKLNGLSIRVEKLHAMATVQQAINLGNTACLSSDESLVTAELVIPSGEEGEVEPEIARERYLTFIWLNSQELIFLAERNELIDKGYHESSGQGVLKRMLSRGLARDMVRKRGYHPDFISHCESIIQEIDSKSASDSTGDS